VPARQEREEVLVPVQEVRDAVELVRHLERETRRSSRRRAAARAPAPRGVPVVRGAHELRRDVGPAMSHSMWVRTTSRNAPSSRGGTAPCACARSAARAASRVLVQLGVGRQGQFPSTGPPPVSARRTGTRSFSMCRDMRSGLRSPVLRSSARKPCGMSRTWAPAGGRKSRKRWRHTSSVPAHVRRDPGCRVRPRGGRTHGAYRLDPEAGQGTGRLGPAHDHRLAADGAINGELTPIPYEPLTREMSELLLFEIMDAATRARYDANKDVDFSYEVPTSPGRAATSTSRARARRARSACCPARS